MFYNLVCILATTSVSLFFFLITFFHSLIFSLCLLVPTCLLHTFGVSFQRCILTVSIFWLRCSNLTCWILLLICIRHSVSYFQWFYIFSTPVLLHDTCGIFWYSTLSFFIIILVFQRFSIDSSMYTECILDCYVSSSFIFGPSDIQKLHLYILPFPTFYPILVTYVLFMYYRHKFMMSYVL